MKNKLMKRAEDALRPLGKEFSDKVQRFLTVHALSENDNEVISGLLDIIDHRVYKPRRRPFRTCWVELMIKMAYSHQKGKKEVHRSEFAVMNTNDFDKLQHWGFIAKGSQAGYWKLTRQGASVIKNNISFPKFIEYRGSGMEAWHLVGSEFTSRLKLFGPLNNSQHSALSYVIKNGCEPKNAQVLVDPETRRAVTLKFPLG